MFKITPIQTVEEQAKLANSVGTTLKPGYFAYKMIDNDTQELMGFSQFEIRDDHGYISDLLSNGEIDYEAMFILGRATMNFIDLCGNHTCRAASNAAEERLIKAIGFKLTEDGDYFADMTDMFSGHCDGKAVDLDKH